MPKHILGFGNTGFFGFGFSIKVYEIHYAMYVFKIYKMAQWVKMHAHIDH